MRRECQNQVKSGYNRIRANFAKALRQVGILKYINNAVNIPEGIITAKLMADVVSFALKGDIQKVIFYSIAILLSTILFKIIKLCLSVLLSRKDKCARHKCKMILYNQIFMSPMYLQYKKSGGQILENSTDDLNTIISLYALLYPNLFIGIATVVLYTAFLGMESVLAAAALPVISLLQIIPPLVVKKYMQINYSNSREAEGELTDFTVAAYEGMATIKLYGLKEWYLEKLTSVQNKCRKFVQKAELTMAEQNAMETFVDNILKYGMYAMIGLFVFLGMISTDTGVESIVLAGGLFPAMLSIFNCIPQFALVKKAEERLSIWFEFSKDGSFLFRDNSEILKVEGLTHKYGEKTLFENVSLTVGRCETVIIKGENGSGKSTLLNVICGLEKKQHGDVIFGMDNMLWGRKIIYLSQNDMDYNFPAKELIEMIDKSSVNSELLSEWGLSKEAIDETDISSISGGEKKKVYLAVALALNPDLLILDEPSNSLDSDAVMMLKNKLQMREKATVIVTHDNAFDSLSSKIYTFKNGGAEVGCGR
ncbi:MAG: ABC transporter ATP-binding protein/permease [Clostridia bacterium]|nr:ABC transporter ATP-binding protein/permease [Clostridia bacterium]